MTGHGCITSSTHPNEEGCLILICMLFCSTNNESVSTKDDNVDVLRLDVSANADISVQV